jgi:hypothetical protein
MTGAPKRIISDKPMSEATVSAFKQVLLSVLNTETMVENIRH